MVRTSVGIRLLLIESQREAAPCATEVSCRSGKELVVALAARCPAMGYGLAVAALPSQLVLTERR